MQAAEQESDASADTVSQLFTKPQIRQLSSESVKAEHIRTTRTIWFSGSC